MKQTFKSTQSQNQKVREQWKLEQGAYEVTALEILEAQLFYGVRYLLKARKINPETPEYKTFLKLFLNQETLPTRITYQPDVKGRPSWCIEIFQRKGATQDFLHYSEDYGEYVWTSNEGESRTSFEKFIKGWEGDLKKIAYETYAVKNLFYWGLTQDGLATKLSPEQI